MKLQYTVQSVYQITDVPGAPGANITLVPVDGDASEGVLLVSRDPRLFDLTAGDTVTICVKEDLS